MFMWGPAPIRRTMAYLKSGNFFVKDDIRIMEVHYHLHGKRYISREEMKKDYFHGLRQFYFWEMPRIQYQNPRLQIVRILDKMPTPYIRFWCDDGRDIIFDCFNQTQQEILSRITEIVGKSEDRLRLEETTRKEVEGEENPALLGYRRKRFCGCEILGQHPCPGTVRRPRFSDVETQVYV